MKKKEEVVYVMFLPGEFSFDIQKVYYYHACVCIFVLMYGLTRERVNCVKKCLLQRVKERESKEFAGE